MFRSGQTRSLFRPLRLTRCYASTSQGIALYDSKSRPQHPEDTAAKAAPSISGPAGSPTSSNPSTKWEVVRHTPPKTGPSKVLVDVDPEHGLYRFFAKTVDSDGGVTYDPFQARDSRAPLSGRAWEAAELRLKSFSDLHTLWYVLLRERNLLATRKENMRRVGAFVDGAGAEAALCRKSMARIKYVLNERRLAYEGALKMHSDAREKEDAAQLAAKQDTLVLEHKLKTYYEVRATRTKAIQVQNYIQKRAQQEGRLLEEPEDGGITGDEALSALRAETDLALREAKAKATRMKGAMDAYQLTKQMRRDRKEILAAAKDIRKAALTGTYVDEAEKERWRQEALLTMEAAKRFKKARRTKGKKAVSTLLLGATPSQHDLHV